MKKIDEQYVELTYEELNLSEDDLEKLYNFGLNHIKESKRLIIEYAVNVIMDELLEKLHPESNDKEKIDFLKDFIKLRI